MKTGTKYIIFGCVWVLVVALAILIPWLLSLPKPDVKDIKFVSINPESSYTEVNLSIEIRNDNSYIYAKDFAINADGIPIGAKCIKESIYSTNDYLCLDAGNYSLIVEFDILLDKVDKPIKVLYKGKIIK